IGMVVTGIAHLSIGLAVIGVLIGSGGEDGKSGIAKAAGAVMQWPGGRWIIGIAGLVTVGAGIYYIHKAWKQGYRKHLQANHFTLHWNPVLRAGVAAQGVIIALIGGFLVYAAVTANPDEAGGVGEVFDWLSQQTFGNILVVIICVGLLGFALFCAVNAVYRIIPKASGPDIETLAQRLEQSARDQVA
ncbi:hypothetical protein LCGC14_2366630, partial [marine sediment metagenome]